MGKETTKFTNEIGRLTGVCQAAADHLGEVIKERQPFSRMARLQITQMDLAAARHMPGGVQTEGSEERVEQDPQYIRASAQLEQINQRILVSDYKIRAAKPTLRTALTALQDENTKFEAFVKKKKSKWLGSKKSVPAAEGCIQAAKDYIAGVRHLLNRSAPRSDEDPR